MLRIYTHIESVVIPLLQLPLKKAKLNLLSFSTKLQEETCYPRCDMMPVHSISTGIVAEILKKNTFDLGRRINSCTVYTYALHKTLKKLLRA
jgi:hypothetical protein